MPIHLPLYTCNSRATNRTVIKFKTKILFASENYKGRFSYISTRVYKKCNCHWERALINVFVRIRGKTLQEILIAIESSATAWTQANKHLGVPVVWRGEEGGTPSDDTNDDDNH